jgi:hypothetical protein
MACTRRLLGVTFLGLLAATIIERRRKHSRRARARAAIEREAAATGADAEVHTVSSLHVYPVKSCAGSQVASLEIDRWGVVHDRRFMVYRSGSAARFITQRTHPRMALMQAHVREQKGGALELTLIWTAEPGARELWGFSPYMPPVEHTVRVVPTDAEALARVRVGIWDDTVSTLDLGDTVASWLSAHLREPVRLCWTGLDFERPVDARYAPSYALREGGATPQVSMADGYPLLLASTASLQRLNDALVASGADPIPMDRFRPNVVVHTSEPFEEDRWKRVRIGSTEFAVVKGCSRCKMPTIDQATAMPAAPPLGSTGLGEPNVTLSKFRKHDGEVYFGQNLIPIGESGTIADCDHVVVLEKGEPSWDQRK